MFSFGQLGNLAAIVTNLTFKQKQRASSLLSHCDESQVGLDEVDDNALRHHHHHYWTVASSLLHIITIIIIALWHQTYSGTGQRSASPSVAVRPMLITIALCLLYFVFCSAGTFVFFTFCIWLSILDVHKISIPLYLWVMLKKQCDFSQSSVISSHKFWSHKDKYTNTNT